MPKWLRNTIIVLVLILLSVGIGMAFFNRGMGTILALEIVSPDFSTIPDGTYEGSFTQNRWSYSVRVQVGAGILEDITVTHSNHETVAGKWNEQIVLEILQKQSLDIQGVTGATVTTKALLRSIENAFRGVL